MGQCGDGTKVTGLMKATLRMLMLIEQGDRHIFLAKCIRISSTKALHPNGLEVDRLR